MTNIEQKALELVNATFREPYYKDWDHVPQGCVSAALLRAIERHEAFRQEVSDAVTDAIAIIDNGEEEVAIQELSRFIIAKPDPLVEVVKEVEMVDGELAVETAKAYHAALAKRGLEIKEKGK